MDTERDNPDLSTTRGRPRAPRVARRWLPLLIVFSACGGEPPAPPFPPLPARTVQVGMADRSTRAIVTEMVGTVRSVHEAAIASLVSGTVTEVRVNLGSPVRAGEVLVRLSARELESRREQARAVFALATQERDRAIALGEQGAITVAQHQAALAQWSVAHAQQAEASTAADRTVLRAPFAGVITGKLVTVGDTTLPGRPLLTLESRTASRFEAQIPEAASDQLTVGQRLPVRIDGLGRELEGRLAELHPSSDDASRTRLVKVDLPETPGLRSGQFGRVLLAAGRADMVTVPADAVVRHGQLESVFVVDAGIAHLRLVRCGGQQNGRTQISSGLAGGETVALAEGADLTDGQPVQVSP